MQITHFKTPLLGLSLLGGALLVAGCNQAGTQTASTANTTTVAQNEAPPAGSSAAQSQAKTGDDHGHSSDAAALEAHPHATKLLFAASPGEIPVGKPATWTLQINDAKTGAPVKDFSVVHDKLMHLIVVSRDLSWFNHIHPEYKGNGTFKVTTTLPRAGAYKLYADYTPKGKTQEVAPHEFSTAGTAPGATNVSLTPDKMNGPWMTKKVVAHPEGEPEAKGGPTYEVALMPMPFPMKAGADSMLHFQVRDAKGVPVKDLQPYLGAMGHAVILSSDTKQYLHSHPMEGGMDGKPHDMSKMGEMKHAAPPKSGGPDVMFHTKMPAAGNYKAWGQFMHKGKIITAAFVVNAGQPDANAKAQTGAGHEHKEGDPPHAH
ncbi:MAG: hypothetical protein KY445_00815 [Armatimonadetes bacterium]|nr:hypothetical protein [Armatimonadota bacterium]